jgi:hypothetical protein
MNIQEINKAIMFGSFTKVELDSIVDSIRWNRAQTIKLTKRALRIGSAVQFTTRTGVTHRGTVNKINIKNIVVQCSTYGRGGCVNVPAIMIEEVA